MNVKGRKRGMKPWNFPGRKRKRRIAAAQRNIAAVRKRVGKGKPKRKQFKGLPSGVFRHAVVSWKQAVQELPRLEATLAKS